MEVIRKKLQVYKEGIESALERADVAEKQAREHKLRADGAENECSLLARRIRLLEEELARSEERLKAQNEQLEEVVRCSDDTERLRKMLEHRAATDEERIEALESSLRQIKLLAEDSDRKYDEVARKLVLVEAELGRTEDRASKAETKQNELEQELLVVGNNLRSLELGEEKLLEQQKSHEVAMKVAQQMLDEAESRAEFAERSVQRLQKEVERLEEALMNERERFKHISEELDQTFSELTAC